MELKKIIRGVFKGGLTLLLILLFACQGMQKMVKPEDRILLLEGGPHSGNWESKKISLDYQYYKQTGEIKIGLRINVKTRARYDGYSVWVLFADAQGKISEEKSIGNGENTFKIPPQTTYLSFRTFLEPHVYKPKISR